MLREAPVSSPIMSQGSYPPLLLSPRSSLSSFVVIFPKILAATVHPYLGLSLSRSTSFRFAFLFLLSSFDSAYAPNVRATYRFAGTVRLSLALSLSLPFSLSLSSSGCNRVSENSARPERTPCRFKANRLFLPRCSRSLSRSDSSGSHRFTIRASDPPAAPRDRRFN